MLSDFLQDSPVYQDLVDKTRYSTLSQAAVDIVKRNFPGLETLARDCVSKVSSTDVLARLIIEISAARAEQDAKRILELSLKA